MPVEVIMPKVDMDMAHGTVAQWHKSEGDTVAQGEPLFDIETDKATMEVEAPASGILRQISARDGEQIDIGTCIAHIYAVGEDTIAPEPLLDVDLTSTAAGPSDSPDLGSIPSMQTLPTEAAVRSPSSGASTEVSGLRATPLARRIARQHGVAMTQIVGSGPRGRINRDDVVAYVNNHDEQVVHAQRSCVDAQMCTASTQKLDALGIAYTVKPVNRMRATIARRLSESKANVPHFYLEQNCQVDKLLEYRQELNTALADQLPHKITLNDLVVQAAARALIVVPEANVAWAGTEVVQFQDAAVSVAVAVEDGLLTPVLRRAQSKTIQELSSELAELALRARQGRLASHDMSGGSMSVSNLGMFGVQRFSAIINPPESMILAVGKAGKQIIADSDGQAKSASVMSVCLSCDHRVVDGAIGARWLQAFQNFIEHPVQLLL